jgi:Ca-activated chloride channel family protein
MTPDNASIAKNGSTGKASTGNARITKAAKPVIELIPERAAVRTDSSTELHVLVRLVPPVPPTETRRPALNIALVIDRSGSMSGAKLRAAKAAATYAVQQLTADDRVSVITYDGEVQTIVPSTLAVDKMSILRAIERIESGGSTALHDGWVEGGVQVSRHLDPQRLNRVILLTDGQANVGETNADRIASDVHGLATRGVTTSTMGLGNDYNEDLLEAIATSGDGNYYFIEGAADLERIFASELKGIMATVGHTVSLGIEPQGGAKVMDVLNDLKRNEYDRLLLPNLIAGNAIEVVVKLQVPAQKQESDVCFFRLAWNTAQSAAKSSTATGKEHSTKRQVMREALVLPAVASSVWAALPEATQVSQAVALLEVARMRQKAIEEMERGDIAAARQQVTSARSYVQAAIPDAAMAAQEDAQFAALERDLEEGEVMHAAKSAKFANYNRRRSR